MGLESIPLLAGLKCRGRCAQDKEDAKTLVPASHAVEFSNVSYEYTPGNPVLRNVSFSIAGGQTLALVGATGAGTPSPLM